MGNQERIQAMSIEDEKSPFDDAGFEKTQKKIADFEEKIKKLEQKAEEHFTKGDEYKAQAETLKDKVETLKRKILLKNMSKDEIKKYKENEQNRRNEIISKVSAYMHNKKISPTAENTYNCIVEYIQKNPTNFNNEDLKHFKKWLGI